MQKAKLILQELLGTGLIKAGGTKLADHHQQVTFKNRPKTPLPRYPCPWAMFCCYLECALARPVPRTA
eukprot:6463603-Amphidinium_carterae.1